MAQEKLLFPLIIAILLGTLILGEAFAGEQEEQGLEGMQIQGQKINVEDRSFFEGLANTSRLVAAKGIKEQYMKLLKMQGQRQSGDIEDPLVLNNAHPVVSLKVFVSNSMSPSLLKTYVSQARKYKASLIFKVLIDDSWTKTRELVFAIAGDGEPASILIDDGQFDEFGVTSVPTIVLAQEDNIADMGEDNQEPKLFDRVVGNIGIRGALELFAKEGDLYQQAEQLLGAKK